MLDCPAVIPNKRLIAALALTLAGGCGRRSGEQALPAAQALMAAVQPSALVANLRAQSGAHYHATLMFRITPTGAEAGSKDVLTTTTDLWLDKQGNFRLLETNDQDGGREVVRVGNELGVALRYARMIRRPAQDPEPQRFLEEAVGQPWTAWDVVFRYLSIEPAGNGLRLGRRAEPGPVVPATTGLKKWHESIEVESLSGEARTEAGGLRAFTLKARFRAKRDAGPVEGEIAVAAQVDQAGAVAPVTMPEADPLPVRQRTILEERALLTGLGGRVPAPAAPKKAPANKRAAAPAKSPPAPAASAGKKAKP
jgi:hypothetical protein